MAIIDYKEKYEKAVQAAMLAKHDTESAVTIGILEEIFPELKESEGERIRENIIATIHLYYGEPLEDEAKEMVAWLEKQGEKTSDKIAERARTEKQRVLLTETNGTANIDWDTRSIQDVKLLLEYGLDYIKKLEKQGEQKPNNKVELATKSYITPNSKFFQWIYDRLIYVHHENPDVDYMRSLKERIEDMQKAADTEKGAKGNERENPNLEPPLTLKHAKEVMGIKQNHAWSEEDERMLNEVILGLKVLKYKDSGEEEKAACQREIDWLESLKERYVWKPSDEQMKALNYYLKNDIDNDGVFGSQLVTLYQDLLKLRKK